MNCDKNKLERFFMVRDWHLFPYRAAPALTIDIHVSVTSGLKAFMRCSLISGGCPEHLPLSSLLVSSHSLLIMVYAARSVQRRNGVRTSLLSTVSTACVQTRGYNSTCDGRTWRSSIDVNGQRVEVEVGGHGQSTKR